MPGPTRSGRIGFGLPPQLLDGVAARFLSGSVAWPEVKDLVRRRNGWPVRLGFELDR
jgi:hypothetical protein